MRPGISIVGNDRPLAECVANVKSTWNYKAADQLKGDGE